MSIDEAGGGGGGGERAADQGAGSSAEVLKSDEELARLLQVGIRCSWIAVVHSIS